MNYKLGMYNELTYINNNMLKFDSHRDQKPIYANYDILICTNVATSNLIPAGV